MSRLSSPVSTLTPRALRQAVCGVLDDIVSVFPAASQDGGVLIVRLDAIGDFVLWLRAARHLRELLPGQRIVLAANATWSSLAERLPYWDEVLAVDVTRLQTHPVYRAGTLLKIRRSGFSTTIQPTYSRTIFRGDSVVRASAASRRIGADGDMTSMPAALKRVADGWYTKLVATGETHVTEIERNHGFLQGLGWHDARMSDYRLPRVAAAPSLLPIGRPYFVVFPGAAWSGRRWPEAEFARLIDAISGDHGWLPVLCGSSAEHGLCADIAARSTASTVNLAGKTSLPDFCELVRESRLLVGNETSAVHIAAAVGTPSVCLLGGGHFGRFVPYPVDLPGASPEPVYESMPCFGCNWSCHLPYVEGGAVPCVAAITGAAALAAVRRVLADSASAADKGAA